MTSRPLYKVIRPARAPDIAVVGVLDYLRPTVDDAAAHDADFQILRCDVRDSTRGP